MLKSIPLRIMTNLAMKGHEYSFTSTTHISSMMQQENACLLYPHVRDSFLKEYGVLTLPLSESLCRTCNAVSTFAGQFQVPESHAPWRSSSKEQ